MLVTGVTVALSGVGMAACSSSSATGTPQPDTDASTSGDGGSTGKDSGQAGGDSGGPTTDSGCGNAPTLHTSTAGSVFCGYPADGGSSFSCNTGEQCCLGGKVGSSFDPEECVPFGTACTNPVDGGVPIQCGQNSDCTANGVTGAACCLKGSGVPALATGCTYDKASGGTAVMCEESDAATPTCAAGEVQICSSNTDCPTGKTCTPMKWKLYQVGFCQ